MTLTGVTAYQPFSAFVDGFLGYQQFFCGPSTVPNGTTLMTVRVLFDTTWSYAS